LSSTTYSAAVQPHKRRAAHQGDVDAADDAPTRGAWMHDASLTWTADHSAIDNDARRAHEIYVEDKGTDIGQPPRRVSCRPDLRPAA
jgi:hypothetical protein